MVFSFTTDILKEAQVSTAAQLRDGMPDDKELHRTEEMIAEALRLARNRSPEARALLQENVRLQCLYPSEYVAYIDCWHTEGDVRSLRRRVVAHGPSLKDIHHVLAKLPSPDRTQVLIDYVLDPEQEHLDSHNDLCPIDH
jgi:hypothetical protein